MFVVYKVFDDNTAIILDIPSYKQIEMTEKELIEFGSNHDVIGLSISKQKINYINSYKCITFPSEDEANEYIKYNNLSYQNKRYIQGYWYAFEKTNHKIHVDYYVCYWHGDTATYLSKDGKYTNYIQSAKSFDKHTAGKKAALMRKNSKTGKYWTTQRIVCDNTYKN